MCRRRTSIAISTDSSAILKLRTAFFIIIRSVQAMVCACAVTIAMIERWIRIDSLHRRTLIRLETNRIGSALTTRVPSKNVIAFVHTAHTHISTYCAVYGDAVDGSFNGIACSIRLTLVTIAKIVRNWMIMRFLMVVFEAQVILTCTSTRKFGKQIKKENIISVENKISESTATGRYSDYTGLKCLQPSEQGLMKCGNARVCVSQPYVFAGSILSSVSLSRTHHLFNVLFICTSISRSHASRRVTPDEWLLKWFRRESKTGEYK